MYRHLAQTTPENMQKNISLFSVDPATRYLNINPLSITPAQVNTELSERQIKREPLTAPVDELMSFFSYFQVRHLVDTGQEVGPNTDLSDIMRLPSPGHLRPGDFAVFHSAGVFSDRCSSQCGLVGLVLFHS